MAFDPKTFTADLLKDVQLDEATKAALQNAFGNSIVAKRLEESTLRQSDYSKKINEAEAEVRKAQEYWNSLRSWDQNTKGKLEQELDTLKKQLVNEGIDPEQANRLPANVVSKEELNRLANESVMYQNTLLKLGLQHYKEFGDILDTDELIKVAQRDGVNISIAHDRMVQPKRAEIQQAEVQKMIASAREEGRLEALKNVTIPVTEQPFVNSVPHSLDKLDPAKAAPEYGAMAAVKAFQQNFQTNRSIG